MSNPLLTPQQNAELAALRNANAPDMKQKTYFRVVYKFHGSYEKTCPHKHRTHIGALNCQKGYLKTSPPVCFVEAVTEWREVQS